MTTGQPPSPAYGAASHMRLLRPSRTPRARSVGTVPAHSSAGTVLIPVTVVAASSPTDAWMAAVSAMVTW